MNWLWEDDRELETCGSRRGSCQARRRSRRLDGTLKAARVYRDGGLIHSPPMHTVAAFALRQGRHRPRTTGQEAAHYKKGKP